MQDIQEKQTSQYFKLLIQRDMLNFDINLGLASSTHFVYHSSRKKFLMLYSIN